MKKSLLIAVLSICCTSAFSQVKIYPKVGMVVSSQKLDFGKGENRDNSKIHHSIGMQAGVGFEQSLASKLALTTDILYAQLGYIDRFKTPYQEWEDVYKLNYLLTPVSVKYYATNGPFNQLFFTAGAYGGVFLNGVNAYTQKELQRPFYENSDEQRIGVNDGYGYDMLDWGLQFGTGMHFILGKSEFVANASYALGISEVHETSYTYWARGSSEVGAAGRNRFFSISLGYALPS